MRHVILMFQNVLVQNEKNIYLTSLGKRIVGHPRIRLIDWLDVAPFPGEKSVLRPLIKRPHCVANVGMSLKPS